MLSPNKNAITIPKLKNGPNGILLLSVMFFLEKSNKKIPRIAPIQKEKIIAIRPFSNPSIHPAAKAIFESPKPIHRPREVIHSRKKKRKKDKPAKKPTRLAPSAKNQ